MRIAYFAHLNHGHGSGVVSKIASQCDEWRRSGHTVRLFVVTSDTDTSWQAKLGDITLRRYGGRIARFRAMTGIVGQLRAFKPRLTYLRMDLFYPSMAWLPAEAPLVVEVNTDDVIEYALGSRLRSRYNLATRALTLRRASSLVFVTRELSRLPSFDAFEGRREVISNGIRLADYTIAPPIANTRPRLVFVGTADQPWQGIDKVQALAALRPDWAFDIVGQAQPGGSTPNIRWHGRLDRAAVASVLAQADVGIGTLALHRKGMHEASPLKVREYLAVGLPLIYGYTDPDLVGLDGYVLQIANTPSNVVDEIDRISRFVADSQGLRVPRAKVGHLDTSEKERQRMTLFTDLAPE